MLPLLNKRVLVVDDEPNIRDLVAEALREANFEVETASNGVEALKLMQGWVPDAIVLDLMMPRLDGTGFTELMRLNPRLANVPVLLVTAAYGAAKAAQQVGAAAWLSKPFELDHLVALVAQLAGSPAPLPAFDVACQPPATTNAPQLEPEALTLETRDTPQLANHATRRQLPQAAVDRSSRPLGCPSPPSV